MVWFSLGDKTKLQTKLNYAVESKIDPNTYELNTIFAIFYLRFSIECFEHA